ncbi:MAG: phage tail tape measure protein [Acidobacteria bacterium]|nr:phage tail tape measure protein [Acidobacteriota bacterium]
MSASFEVSLVLRTTDEASGAVSAAMAKAGSASKAAGTTSATAWSKATSGMVTFEASVTRAGAALKKTGQDGADGADKARRAAERYAKALDDLHGKAGEVASSVRNAGMVAMGAGAATAYGAGKAIQAYAEMESVITRARLPFMRREGTDPVWDQIQPIIERLGQQLPGTTADFSEMAGSMRAAGLASTAIRDGGLEAAAALKILGNLTNEEAGGLTVQMSRALEVGGKDFRAFANLVQKTSFAAGISIRELATAIPYMGPQFKAFGLTGMGGAEAMGTVMTMMKGAGLSGSEIGTSIGELMDSLPILQERLVLGRGWKAKEGAALLQKYSLGNLGAQLFDEKGELRGADPLAKMANVVMVFDRINKSITSTKDKQLLFTELLGGVGKRAGLNFTAENWNESQKKLQDQADIQVRMDEVMKTLSAQWEALTGTGKIFLMTVVEPLVPLLKWITTGLNTLTGKLSDWHKAHPKLTGAIGGSIGVAAFLALTVGGLLIGVGLLGKVLLSSVKGMSDWRNLISLSRIAVKGLGTDAALSTAKLGALKLAEGGGGVTSGLASLFGGGASGLLGGLGGWFSGLGSAVAGVIGAITWPVALAIVAAAMLIYKYWEPIKAFFKGIWSGIQMDMEPILGLWESFKEAILGVWEAVSSLIEVFIPLKSGQEGVNEAFGAGQVVGLALAWAFKAILATATYVAKGVEAVVIVVASLIDAVVTLVKSLYHLATGNVKAAGTDWSSFSDRFWKRLENSSMNPDKPAQKAELAAGPARLPKTLGGSPRTPMDAPGEDGKGKPSFPAGPLMAQPQAAPVSLTYSPKVELKGAAGPDDEARIMAILRKHGDEFADMIQQRFDRKLRWNGAR